MNKSHNESIQFPARLSRDIDTLKSSIVSTLKKKGWSKIAIWGTGNNGSLLALLLIESEIQVECFYDDFSEDSTRFSLPVLKPIEHKSLPNIPVVIAINRDTALTSNIVSRLVAEKQPYLYFESASSPSHSGLVEERCSRMSLSGTLNNLKTSGFTPDIIIDVGAAFGNWTRDCLSIFPDSDFFLFEPLEEEYRVFHENLKKSHSDSSLTFIYAAASDFDGEQIFNVHPDWSSSSLYKEAEGKFVDGCERRVRCCKLDTALSTTDIKGQILLKIDTQGNELKVLQGSSNLLAYCGAVMLEVSFYPFFIGGPLFSDVINFMETIGFIIHDISEVHYKILDNSMAQADVLFVSKDNPLHCVVDFASREQRAEKVASFERSVKTMISQVGEHK